MTKNQAFEILSRAGGFSAARIITQHHNKISALRVYWMARQLRRGMPIAKIIRLRWFYGLPFYTDKWTLDPRPDTETIVDAILASTVNNEQSTEHIKILDLGTGTGCIIAAIVKNIPNASGVGIDKSFMAVRTARKNVRDLELADRIKIERGDFTSQLVTKNSQLFDIIVANPPYIARNDKRLNTGATYDPAMALFAKKNGLGAYESIAKNSGRWLKPRGNIYLEIGIDQGIAVRDIFAAAGWTFVKSWNDLSSVERVLCFTIL